MLAYGASAAVQKHVLESLEGCCGGRGGGGWWWWWRGGREGRGNATAGLRGFSRGMEMSQRGGRDGGKSTRSAADSTITVSGGGGGKAGDEGAEVLLEIDLSSDE